MTRWALLRLRQVPSHVCRYAASIVIVPVVSTANSGAVSIAVTIRFCFPRAANSITESDIVIRAYQPGDEHGLSDLFSRCYGRPISLAHWRWKLQSTCADYENIWVAIYEDRHVGHYAGIPVDAWVRVPRQSAGYSYFRSAGFDAICDRKQLRPVFRESTRSHG